MDRIQIFGLHGEKGIFVVGTKLISVEEKGWNGIGMTVFFLARCKCVREEEESPPTVGMGPDWHYALEM